MASDIIVCGQKFDIGTKVILWNDANGFNGYDTSKNVIEEQNRKTGKITRTVISGVRYSRRSLIHSNPDLNKLKNIVTQFFLHHSGLYRAKDTFNVLHNQRRLSVHFILDDNGVIYQTLDLREKAWHGGINNPMSVGIEIDSRAHASRFPDAYDLTKQRRYGVGPRRKRIDYVQKSWVLGYEYNDAQYRSLIMLAIALKKIFPKMGQMQFPMKNGIIIKSVMNNPKEHRGLICHYNNSSQKNDPISLDHYRLLNGIKYENPDFGSTFVVAETWRDRQELLSAAGFNPGPIDGVFGPQTLLGIKKFQSASGLNIDGVWGGRTEYMIDLVLKERGIR